MPAGAEWARIARSAIGRRDRCQPPWKAVETMFGAAAWSCRSTSGGEGRDGLNARISGAAPRPTSRGRLDLVAGGSLHVGTRSAAKPWRGVKPSRLYALFPRDCPGVVGARLRRSFVQVAPPKGGWLGLGATQSSAADSPSRFMGRRSDPCSRLPAERRRGIVSTGGAGEIGASARRAESPVPMNDLEGYR